MPDETVALQEIASLLRRRVEQQDEMAKRSEETLSKFQEQQSVVRTGAQIREDSENILKEGERRRDEMTAKMEAKTEQAKQEREEFQQAQRQFQERLLAELERHNTLLEGLLQHLIEGNSRTMS